MIDVKAMPQSKNPASRLEGKQRGRMDKKKGRWSVARTRYPDKNRYLCNVNQHPHNGGRKVHYIGNSQRTPNQQPAQSTGGW